jgi:hypothetical protein
MCCRSQNICADKNDSSNARFIKLLKTKKGNDLFNLGLQQPNMTTGNRKSSPAVPWTTVLNRNLVYLFDYPVQETVQTVAIYGNQPRSRVGSVQKTPWSPRGISSGTPENIL